MFCVLSEGDYQGCVLRHVLSVGRVQTHGEGKRRRAETVQPQRSVHWESTQDAFCPPESIFKISWRDSILTIHGWTPSREYTSSQFCKLRVWVSWRSSLPARSGSTSAMLYLYYTHNPRLVQSADASLLPTTDPQPAALQSGLHFIHLALFTSVRWPPLHSAICAWRTVLRLPPTPDLRRSPAPSPPRRR